MIECTVPEGETIVRGDALCVIDFDTNNNRPTVKRATRDNVATSKTIFGVAKNSKDDFEEQGTVIVLVAGDVAENDVTGLGAGNSRIIATDIDKPTAEAQCRLIRTDRPDGAEFVVGTCDEKGNLAVQPRASRDRSTRHAYNVHAYGAVPNWDGTKALDDGTANLAAFEAALAAMAADDNKSAILVADGHFFLSGTLHIRQTVIFEGTGRNHPTVGGQRSSPGTWLVFPRDCDGIRLHSSADGLGGGAEFSVLRNLTIYCKESRPNKIPNTNASPPLPGQTGHGVHANCLFRAENMNVQNFGEHGFFISATALPPTEPAEPGNASGFVLDSCVISECGGEGVHIIGADASVSLIANCNASACFGWGLLG